MNFMLAKNLRKDRHTRSAFTLLELMIALMILAVLMGLVWSMMESYRDLEQRGRQQTQQARKLRALHATLESDWMHCTTSATPSVALPFDRAPSSTRRSRRNRPPIAPTTSPTPMDVRGTDQEFAFTATVSTDPVPVLDAALHFGEQPPWMPRCTIGVQLARIQYRFEIESEVEGFDPTFRLTRTWTNLPTPMQLAERASSNEVRLPADRMEPGETLEENLDPSFGRWQIVWEHLANPRIRYSNGTDWVGGWGDPTQPPVAIEIAFDFESAARRHERDWLASQTELFPNDESSMLDRQGGLALVPDRVSQEIPRSDVRLIVRGGLQ